jgi:hypothetical protein
MEYGMLCVVDEGVFDELEIGVENRKTEMK